MTDTQIQQTALLLGAVTKTKYTPLGGSSCGESQRCSSESTIHSVSLYLQSSQNASFPIRNYCLHLIRAAKVKAD